MSLKSLYKAIVHDTPEPPRGVIASQVSAAYQEHEWAIARFNRLACDIEHGEDCHCCEHRKGTST